MIDVEANPEIAPNSVTDADAVGADSIDRISSRLGAAAHAVGQALRSRGAIPRRPDRRFAPSPNL